MLDKLHIGVDIGGTHMRCALVDGTGRIWRRLKAATDIALGPEQAAERLILECRSLMEAARELGGRVEGVGLGVAGKIDRKQGRVVFSPNLPGMNGYPLAEVARERLKLPVIMENDANAFGIGESWMGSGRSIRNWIGLTLGTGVGGCLILNGTLWSGDDLGFVGEMGHMTVDPAGPMCVCGLKGCLEAHASGRALCEGVAAAIARGEIVGGPLYDLWQAGGLSAEAVYKEARQGDALAMSLFERMGWALGVGIGNVLTVLGIRHAILGGGVSAGWDCFIGPLRRSLAEHSSMLAVHEITVLATSLGDDAALLGAAHLAGQSLSLTP